MFLCAHHFSQKGLLLQNGHEFKRPKPKQMVWKPNDLPFSTYKPTLTKRGIKFNIRLPLYYILMVPHLHQILRITHNVELASFHFWWGLSKSFWWTNQTVASWLLKKVENLFSLILLLNFHFEMVADRWKNSEQMTFGAILLVHLLFIKFRESWMPGNKP